MSLFKTTICKEDELELTPSQRWLSGELSHISVSRDGLTTAEIMAGATRHRVVGRMAGFENGDRVSAFGIWTHDRVGLYFAVESAQAPSALSTEASVKWLSGPSFRGVGEKVARKIVDASGANLMENLQSLEWLAEQIGEKLAAVVIAGASTLTPWDMTRIALAGAGVGDQRANKIQATFGDRARLMIYEHPYDLAVINGFGWAICDQIALRVARLLPNDTRRILACLSFVMTDRTTGSGDCGVTREHLIETVASELQGVPQLDIARLLDREIDEDRLIIERRDGSVLIMPEELRRDEIIVAAKIAELLAEPVSYVDQAHIATALESMQRKVREQIYALEDLAKERIACLLGGAGVGKSTVSRQLADYLKLFGYTVLGLTYTASAAKRLRATARIDTGTIHSKLQYDFREKGFRRNEKNPFTETAILLDEASLVDLELMASLMRAIGPRCRLYIIGDDGQLPSIGPGQVLKDIVESGCVPVVRLLQNQRTGAGSAIAEGARLIENGSLPPMPRFEWSKLADRTKLLESLRRDPAIFIETASEDIASAALGVLETVGNRDAVSQIQFLSPMKRFIAGTNILNSTIQAWRHQRPKPNSDGKFAPQPIPKDLVVQTVNNKWLKLSNGERGDFLDKSRIKTKFGQEEAWRVRWTETGAETQHLPGDQKHLELGYATSVHKSQGWEYPIVVLILVNNHYVMLSREVFKTGWSRAQAKIILLGQVKAAHVALRRPAARRITMLDRRIQACARPGKE